MDCGSLEGLIVAAGATPQRGVPTAVVAQVLFQVRLVGRQAARQLYHLNASVLPMLHPLPASLFIALAVGLGTQVLQGLTYLHKERHAVHRDLKPANVLINTAGARRQRHHRSIPIIPPPRLRLREVVRFWHLEESREYRRPGADPLRHPRIHVT